VETGGKYAGCAGTGDCKCYAKVGGGVVEYWELHGGEE
jgi:hypothetical protein